MDSRDAYIPPPLQMPDGKVTPLNAAKKVICAAASEWSGVEVSAEQGRVPIVRGGKVVSWHGTLLTSPIGAILMAADLEKPSNLIEERKQLERLLKLIAPARTAWEGLDASFRQRLGRSWGGGGTGGRRGYGEPVDVVHALGVDDAFHISMHGVILNIENRLSAIEEELALSREPGRGGKPRNRPAYEVALKFAQLYAMVKGERPTLSDGDYKGLYYGSFSPALRDLFDALGWETTKIDKPATAAIAEVTDEYIQHFDQKLTQLPVGFWGVR